MITKAQISKFASLSQKKYRKNHELFIVEGFKSVSELLQSDWSLEELICRSDVNAEVFDRHCEIISPKEFDRISNHKSGDGYLAVVTTRTHELPQKTDNVLLLDGISDPGNLGTIIRTADWYGIKQLLCTNGCADLYNPKTVSASMGSIFRLAVNYVEPDLLKEYKNSHEILGTSLKGDEKWSLDQNKAQLIVIGSESHGMSGVVESYCDKLVKLERLGEAESLNAGIACGIILDRCYAQNR